MPAFAGTPTTAASNSATSLVLAKPAGVADGDMLFAATMFRQTPVDLTTAPATPSGWTLLNPHLDNNAQNETWRKNVPTASAETATSYTFTTAETANRCCGIMARVSGVDLSAPVDSNAATATSGLTAGSITTVAPGALLVLYAVVHFGSLVTLDLTCAGMTRIGQIQAGSTAVSCLAVFAEPRPAAGSTGGRTITVAGGTPTSSTTFMQAFAPIGTFGIPTNLAYTTANNAGNRDVLITWNAVSGATGYDVDRDSQVIASNVGTNSYTDSARPPVTFATYRVRARQ